MPEQWKDINGYEGFYQVSNLGNVKSLDRYVERVSNSEVVKVKRKGCIIIQGERPNGYNKVELYKNGNCKTFSVHRLVAECFISNKKNVSDVNHKNGNKSDNRVENLEWCTHSENELHAHRTNLKQGSKGASNGMSKLTEEEVLDIRAAYNLGCFSYAKLAKAYNVSKGTIEPLIKRITWKHI